MTSLTRRGFLLAGGAALASASPLGRPVGFQTFPVREKLGQDFEGTLKEMASYGYKAVEMCSPPGYESMGYKPLVGMPAADMKAMFKKLGLECRSCHYTSREFRTNLDERIAFAKDLGVKYMILSSMGLPKDAKLDDWMKAADDLNKAGEQIGKAGIQAGFHNHHGEFAQLDGKLIYDELLKRLDPKLVKMQFQVAVANIGYHAADYMEKYPGRFCSLHLADWSAAEKKTVAVGKGDIDWKKLFSAAKKCGVKDYFVEMDLALMKDSAPFLEALKA
jgi:sugar phosphate isomerase/epimerase